MPTGLYRGNAYIAIDEMASELLYLRFVAVDIWQDDIAQGQEGRTERKIEDDQRNISWLAVSSAENCPYTQETICIPARTTITIRQFIS